MKTIVHTEDNGCGIASVATLVQKPYDEVKTQANAMGIFASDTRLHSSTEYVRQLLSAYGLNASTEEHPFSSWDALPNCALLSTDYHVEDDGLGYRHWVVYYRSAEGDAVVLDPARDLACHERTDFDAIQVQWFIAVDLLELDVDE